MARRAISKLLDEQIATCPTPLDFAAASNHEGRLAEQAAIVRTELVQAIKRCELSRYQIAARLSELHQCEISKDMLDKYTAESGLHYRFPAEWSAGFCLVTGTAGLLQVIAQPARQVVLPLPAGKPVPVQDLQFALLRLVKEVGEAAAELEQDLSDKRLSTDEARRLRKEFQDVVRAAMAALHQVETA